MFLPKNRQITRTHTHTHTNALSIEKKEKVGAQEKIELMVVALISQTDLWNACGEKQTDVISWDEFTKDTNYEKNMKWKVD